MKKIIIADPNVELFDAINESIKSIAGFIVLTTLLFFALLIARTIFSIKFMRSFVKIQTFLPNVEMNLHKLKSAYYSAIQLQTFSLVLLVLMPLLLAADKIFGTNTVTSFLGSLDASGVFGAIIYAVIFIIIEPLVLLDAYIRLSKQVNKLDTENVDFNGIYLLIIAQLLMFVGPIFIFVAIIASIVKVSITALIINLSISGLMIIGGHLIFSYCFYLLNRKMKQLAGGDSRVTQVV